jgi:hypothetical protein
MNILKKKYATREAAYKACDIMRTKRPELSFSPVVFANGKQCSFWDEGERPSCGYGVRYHWQVSKRPAPCRAKHEA